MKKYFVYDVNMLSMNSILPFTAKDTEAELKKAQVEFGADVEYLASKELFQKLKAGVRRKMRGEDTEIILSPVLQQYLDSFRTEFPKAIVWVYDEGRTVPDGPRGPMSAWGNGNPQ